MARTVECFHVGVGNDDRRCATCGLRLAPEVEPGARRALLRKPHAAHRLPSFPPHFLFILIQIVATMIATNINTMMMRMESVLFLVESLL